MDEGIIEEISRKTPIGGSLARVYLKKCSSQQKVDTFLIFYTLKAEYGTPCIV